MSQFNYVIQTLPNGDVQPIRLDPATGQPVGPAIANPFPSWHDPDFKQWLAGQATPPALSPRQQIIQQVKALTLAQWTDGTTLTAAQKDKIAFFAMKLAFEDEIV